VVAAASFGERESESNRSCLDGRTKVEKVNRLRVGGRYLFGV
jgi:hypothetical protein